MKEIGNKSILEAINKIENDPELRKGRNSTTYDLIYDEKPYPPILVLSEANKIEGGGELTLSDFNNDTKAPFKILEEHGFVVQEKGEMYKKILKVLGRDNADRYTSFLKDLVDDLGINQGDNRVVFSLRPNANRLVFTIGQRYCLNIQFKDRVEWGFITSFEKKSLDYSQFDGPVSAFWNKTESFEEVKSSYSDIKEACLVELQRTNKSGYEKYNNQVFEKSIFNKEFRMDLFNSVFDIAEDHEESFFNPLLKFLEQAKTNDLSYSHYVKSFNGLNVRVSFGKGNKAKIPWISFLADGQTTNEGIYPVYLLYEEKNKLILAYGVSEENKPHLNWGLESPISINEYFEKNNLGVPNRYGESYIYKVYDLDKKLNQAEVDQDLFSLTNFYKKIISQESEVKNTDSFDLKSLLMNLDHSNLIYDKSLTTRFASAIMAKPFLILTGLSGSGKTKLAQAFVKWICKNQSQHNLVPVGADWTNREPLLGYPNALAKKDYVLPETGVLQLILRAKNNPKLPYFLILDEMNLSHVERYFADFLSAIESNEEIKLHSGDSEWKSENYIIPPAISVPENLFIIGTVNIDETTYMFSPKVLDRANVIEFKVSRNELARFLKNPRDVDLSVLSGSGASMAEDFVQLAKNNSTDYSKKDVLGEVLLNFFTELNSVGAEFGYRSAFEIQRFAALSEMIADDWKFENIMDAATVQKLLPKLHGSRRKLEKVLFKLGDLCHPETENGCEELFKKHEIITEEEINKARYPISFEKIVRMHKGLVKNGFTSFAEA